MSENAPSMHDTIESAFQAQAKLNEALTDEGSWDRSMKASMRRQVNALKDKMEEVLMYKEELPGEVIEGMEEVIVNTEARLDGKPTRFKADETSYDLAA